MPWNLSGTIIKEGRSWVDASGIRHPTNWMRWTDAEKEAAGLAWVDPVAPHDNRFYHGRDSDGNLIEKNIADVNEVDEDGDPINDADGNQLVTLGLNVKRYCYCKVTSRWLPSSATTGTLLVKQRSLPQSLQLLLHIEMQFVLPVIRLRVR